MGKARVPQDFAGSIHIQFGPSILSQRWSNTRRVRMRKTVNGNGHGTQETEKAQEKEFGNGFNFGNWKRILEQRIISFNFQVYFLRFSW